MPTITITRPDGMIIEGPDDDRARCIGCGYPTQPIGKPARHRKGCAYKMISGAKLRGLIKLATAKVAEEKLVEEHERYFHEN
jgi:hypothetical protein